MEPIENSDAEAMVNPTQEVITDPLAQAVILHVKDGMLMMYSKNLTHEDIAVVLVGAVESARAELKAVMEAQEAAE